MFAWLAEFTSIFFMFNSCLAVYCDGGMGAPGWRARCALGLAVATPGRPLLAAKASDTPVKNVTWLIQPVFIVYT